jgi:hypothetical protein
MSKLELALRDLLKEHKVAFLEQARYLCDDIDKHKWYLSEQAGRDVGYAATIVDWANRYGKFGNPEIIGIEREYKSGKYDLLEDKLASFVEKNNDLIDRVQKKFSTDRLVALKLLLLQRKSVHMPTEVKMQLDEIRTEALYRGTSDHEDVARDWAKKHAAGWRDRYTLVLGFILDTKQEKFQQLLVKSYG